MHFKDRRRIALTGSGSAHDASSCCDARTAAVHFAFVVRPSGAPARRCDGTCSLARVAPPAASVVSFREAVRDVVLCVGGS